MSSSLTPMSIRLKYGPIASLLCFIALIYVSLPYLPSTHLSAYLSPMSYAPEKSSSLSGFLDRATKWSEEERRGFNPPRPSLQLIVLRNAPVEPEGFTFALFSSDSSSIAVDANGNIYTLTPTDTPTLLSLLPQLTALPKQQDSFRNTWVLAQPRTSQPIDRILVPKSNQRLPETPEGEYEQEFDEVSVQGFDGQQRELKERGPEGEKELPEVLFEVTKAVLEARGREGGDEGVVARIKALVQNAF